MSRAERPQIPEAAVLKQLPEDGGPDWNRLVFESSPYLQQHAANPVDWYPWGEAAFARAKAENKPIMLSIGYATCHWCHVMEHESFEDHEVAALLNDSVVCIKVDKEERPDIDDIYMSACLAVNGHGGWPLTCFLTHDGKPFFAGTYFPKRSSGHRIGIMELCRRITHLWHEEQDRVLSGADELTAELAGAESSASQDAWPSDVIRAAARQLSAAYDAVHAGFGGAPKFPSPHNFWMLLRYYHRYSEAAALEMVEKTLGAMWRGGIFDQVGFGFHRYATDAAWLLPHFEKMLYDQALIAYAAVEAFQAGGKPEMEALVRQTFDYCRRVLQDPDGGFYCAEDADSEGEEGKFYVWTMDELEEVLGKSDAQTYGRIFGFKEEGNFREEASGVLTGANIPHLPKSRDMLSEAMQVSRSGLDEFIEGCRLKLFQAREKRVHPFKDDKILTDWNGLMLAALAKAAAVFADETYLEDARRCRDFLMANLRGEDGRLLKRARNGVSGLPAHLDDYAFVIFGLIELYHADGDVKNLEQAVALCDLAVSEFHDGSGAFYLTAAGGESLIVRPRKLYDGALPAGNATMAWNLVRLARLTGKSEYETLAEAVKGHFAGQVRRAPTSANVLICAAEMQQTGTEIVIVGRGDDPVVQEMVRLVQTCYLPNAVLLRKEESDGELAALAPFTADMEAVNGKATAYVCRNFACERPVTDLPGLKLVLGLGKRT